MDHLKPATQGSRKDLRIHQIAPESGLNRFEVGLAFLRERAALILNSRTGRVVGTIVGAIDRSCVIAITLQQLS